MSTTDKTTKMRTTVLPKRLPRMTPTLNSTDKELGTSAKRETPYKGFNLREFGEKADRIYEQHRDKLEKKHRGEIIAIEVDSGDYFVGEEYEEVVKKARKKYPNKLFHFKRVGHDSFGKFHSPVMETDKCQIEF